jgi:hypothetical protein
MIFKKFNSLGMDDVIPYLMRPTTRYWSRFGKTKNLMLASMWRGYFIFWMCITTVFMPIIHTGVIYMTIRSVISARLTLGDIDTLGFFIIVVLATFLFTAFYALQIPAFIFLIRYKKPQTVLQNDTMPGAVERVEG